jgi:hypothetical protein
MDLLKPQKCHRSAWCYSGGILERSDHRLSSLRYFMAFWAPQAYLASQRHELSRDFTPQYLHIVRGNKWPWKDLRMSEFSVLHFCLSESGTGCILRPCLPVIYNRNIRPYVRSNFDPDVSVSKSLWNTVTQLTITLWKGNSSPPPPQSKILNISRYRWTPKTQYMYIYIYINLLIKSM